VKAWFGGIPFTDNSGEPRLVRDLYPPFPYLFSAEEPSSRPPRPRPTLPDFIDALNRLYTRARPSIPYEHRQFRPDTGVPVLRSAVCHSGTPIGFPHKTEGTLHSSLGSTLRGCRDLLLFFPCLKRLFCPYSFKEAIRALRRHICSC